MKRRRPPSTPRMTQQAYNKAVSLTVLTNTDVLAVVETALDLLYLALTKAPDSLPGAARPRKRGPWRQTSTKPVSIAHLMHGIARQGAIPAKKKRKPPHG